MLAHRMPAPSFDQYRIPADQIGRSDANHLALNSSFFLQQLGVPDTVRNVPGSEVPFGRTALSKALPDTGPSSALASAWSADIIDAPGALDVEQFFAPEIHGNDTQLALALGHMPAPAVQYYGQTNDERYPIYGMNAANRDMVNGAGYPAGATIWSSDKRRMLSNTSTDLENLRYRTGKHNVQLGANMPQETLRQTFAPEASVTALHQAAADDHTGSGTTFADDARASLHQLPGGPAADKMSQSYHALSTVVEYSPFAGDSSEMVRNSSLLHIRRDSGTRSASVPPELGARDPALGYL